ncbi:hypothetical protein [Roseomonas indoligenes]|uniref:Uncharacterized protein n=1 Tax=Roseomonas indoligenes TaxID=2820811 RepID=A0A940MZV3_9PROT|nr:hypothetical protein [Pararoseomonas indoligenes]MBP0493929.1 hypothetical protein [Pararoseomonas indoligenes]
MPVLTREGLARARRRAAWRLALTLPLLLAWVLPASAWPFGLGDWVGEAEAMIPVLADAGIAWAFARTLRPGAQPLIAEYIRFDERRDFLACAGYARGLTLFWAVAMAGLAMVELVAALRGADLGWAPEGTLLALFLGEHVVRSLRFPEGGIAWPSQTLRAILRAEVARHG